MSTDTPNGQNDDQAFEQELRALYRAALLDEDFQQQLASDLRSLPAGEQAGLQAAEQTLLRDATLSETARVRLLDTLPPCQAQPAISSQQAWWQRWLPRPWLLLPATLLAGVLLGGLLPSLWLPPASDDLTRGHSLPVAPVAPANTPVDASIRQNPQQWLLVIADLLRQGKVAQARQELQAFGLLYPNYQPPPSP